MLLLLLKRSHILPTLSTQTLEKQIHAVVKKYFLNIPKYYAT